MSTVDYLDQIETKNVDADSRQTGIAANSALPVIVQREVKQKYAAQLFL